MYTEASTSENGQSEFAIKGLTAAQLDNLHSALLTFLNMVIQADTCKLVDIIDELEFLNQLTNQIEEQLIIQAQLEKQTKALVKYAQPVPLPYQDAYQLPYMEHQHQQPTRPTPYIIIHKYEL